MAWFISPAFAQNASADDNAAIGFGIFVVLGVILVFVGRILNKRDKRIIENKQIRRSQPILVKTYTAKTSELASALFEADSVEMAAHSYFPTSQSWAPGQWGAGAFIVAILLIFLFGLGLLILGYMLIVKPDGTLTVTYEHRAAKTEEKTCPKCAEQIKAAALVCHFCGYEFPKSPLPNDTRPWRGV
jgi:hypothetical protein